MRTESHAAPCHPIAALSLAAAFCIAALAGCGGGDADNESFDAQESAQSDDTKSMKVAAAAPTGNRLKVGIRLPGFPHKLDVYKPAGATKAIVFLHGSGGYTWQLAYDLGFNRILAPQTTRNVNWDWLSRNGIIAVFAQGQSISGTQGGTWSNYASNSGQDDVAFLKALATYVKAQYGATEVSLSGHSAGGAMTARLWCEAPMYYTAFVSLAGPMPPATYPLPGPTCEPVKPAPYYVVVGDKDSALQKFATGNFTPLPQQVDAGLTDPILVAEWTRHQDRSKTVCGQAPALESANADTSGSTWSACGARVRYRVVADAEHAIASLEQNAHIRMVDLIAGFVNQ